MNEATLYSVHYFYLTLKTLFNYNNGYLTFTNQHLTSLSLIDHSIPTTTMHLTTSTLLTTLATSTLNLATALRTTANTTTNNNPTNFLLLTTTSATQPTSKNTTHLPSVNATSLFDPLAQTNYFLRLTGPGYNSLPRFNLTSSGTLETEAAGPHGIGEFEYNSTRVMAGEELMFAPEEQEKKGNLGLEGGFLLTVGGEREGWRVCEGELGQSVVSFFFFLLIFSCSRYLLVLFADLCCDAGCLEGR